MQIQRTKDKISLSSQQITAILQAYIEKETGRKVYNRVMLSGGTRSDLYGCYCELVDENIPPVI